MKISRLLICLLLCLPLCLSFVGCSSDGFLPGEQHQDPIYEVSYVSNGDGTCYVDAITVDPERDQPFVLEIPEKSPQGDTVTAIQCAPFSNLIPQMLTEEEYTRLYDLLKQKYKDGEITHQERDVLTWVYNRRDMEVALCGKSNPEATEKTIVYVYHNHVTDGCVITDVPDTEITNALVNVLGYTPKTMQEGYDAIREKINAMESPNRDAMLAALSEFTIPDNLGIYISEIKLPNTVREISSGFYSSCRLIKNIDLPDSITRVTARMFSEMTSLESVSIPEGVTQIDYFAFLGCSGLKHLEIPDSIEVIDPSAFSAHASLNVTHYQSGYYLGNPDNPYLVLYKVSENAVNLTTHPNTKLIYDDAFDKTEKLSTVTLTEGIGKTGVYLFSYCELLSSVTLPDSLTEITHGTFSGCKLLKTVKIPEKVTYIGRNTFSYCSELTEIELPDGIDIIHEMLFRNCKKLKSVNIPENVTEIHNMAFQYCESLKSIVIPKSLRVIGTEAFGESGLKLLCYQGTEADWAKIEFGENAIPESVTICFYSETQPDSEGNYWHYVDGIPVAW